MDKADDAASSESSTLTDTCVRLSLESGEELSVTMSSDSTTNSMRFCENTRHCSRQCLAEDQPYHEGYL